MTSIARMETLKQKRRPGMNDTTDNLDKVTGGFLHGIKHIIGGDPIGKRILLSLQKLTIACCPPHNMVMKSMNLTRPRLSTISNNTSIYLPNEGTSIPAVVKDINAGGMETNQARGATS